MNDPVARPRRFTTTVCWPVTYGDFAPPRPIPAGCLNIECPPHARRRRPTSAADAQICRCRDDVIAAFNYGRGIVRSPDSFGRLSEPPTHPERLEAEAIRGAVGPESRRLQKFVRAKKPL